MNVLMNVNVNIQIFHLKFELHPNFVLPLNNNSQMSNQIINKLSNLQNISELKLSIIKHDLHE